MTEPKLQIKYTMFLDYDKGGYGRTFDSISHPGVKGSVYCKDHKSIPKQEFYYNDKTYNKVSEVIKAWEADNKKESL